MNKNFNNLKNLNLKSYLSQEVENILRQDKVYSETILIDDKIWENSLNCSLDIDYLARKVIILDDESNINYVDTNLNLRNYLSSIKSNLIQNFNPDIHAKLFFDKELDLFKICVYENLKNAESNKTINELVYLSIFAIFERSLGNILFSINGYNKSKIPFLLRDLVNDTLLENLFEKNLSNFIKLLFYTPKSLNLRNLCWHGFFNPEQFDLDYVYFLIALISCIDAKIEKNQVMIKSRAKFCLTTIENLWTKNNLNLFDNFKTKYEKDCLQIIEKSLLIDDCRRIKWKFMFEKNNLTNFSLLTLLLPELEHILRKLYSFANNLESNSSVQIAYTNEFYLTLDDLLAWNIADNQQNLLVNTIEKNSCLLIVDLINYLDGPRLRDHLSHGELNPNISDFYINIITYISFQIASISCENQHDFNEFSTKVNKVYECNFHPIKMLKIEALKLVETELYIKNYSNHITSKDINFEEWDFEDYIKLVYRYERLNGSFNGSTLKSNENKFVNLYRNILKEIQNYLIKINEKKLANDEISKNGNLRERQRNSLSNFKLFIQDFKNFFNCYLRIICFIIEKYVYSKNEEDIFAFYESDKSQKLFKLLKNNLKILQNLSSYCDANKWIESNNLISINKNDNWLLKLIDFL